MLEYQMSHFWAHSGQTDQVIIIIRNFRVELCNYYVSCLLYKLSFVIVKAYILNPLVYFSFRSFLDHLNT
jgi:hypothetical protein